MGNGNRPTPEFRREAVRLALTSGRTRREIAEDLGIGLSTLTRWLGQERDVREPSEVPVDLHAELKRLRRENAVLKQERDIQKEARWVQPVSATARSRVSAGVWKPSVFRGLVLSRRSARAGSLLGRNGLLVVVSSRTWSI